MMANPSRSMMKYRAAISRRMRLESVNGVPVGAQDPYGHATKTTDNPGGWNPTYNACPCMVFQQRGRRVISNERTVSDESLTMAVPLGTDLQEGDRVDQVKDRADNVMFGPLQVTHVTHKLMYIDAELLQVDRGSN